MNHTNQFDATTSDLSKINCGIPTWPLRKTPLRFEQEPIWYETLGKFITNENERAVYLGVKSADKQLAVLPLLLTEPGSQSLTTNIRTLSNYYSSIFEPIFFCEGSAKSAVAGLMMEELVNSFCWHQLNLGPMCSDSDSFRLLVEQAKKLGLAVQPYFWFENWVLDVMGRDFAAYFASLPSQLRNTLKRKSKKLLANEGYEIAIYSGVSNIRAALDEFEQVYRVSWKKPEGIPEFIREFAERAAELGWSRVGVLRIDGVARAAQLWFVKEGVASIFKLAHDEQFKKYSTGTILTNEMLKHAIDVDGVSKIDFLIGGDGYKKDWGFKMQERWGLAIFNRTFKGRMLAFRHIFLSRLKSFALNLLPARRE